MFHDTMVNGVNNSNGVSNGIKNGNGVPYVNGNGNGNGINNGNGNGFNHNTHLQSPLKSRSFWINVVFYFCVVLLAVSVLLYAFFVYESYAEKKTIGALETKIATYGTLQQKASEKQVLDYKKKIDDFAAIIDSHKISLNIFSFIEEKALPSVWFSNFDMSESNGEIRLTGESNSMETLSRQVQVFEHSTDYVTMITVLSSQVDSGNKVLFVLNLVLDPKVFAYTGAASLTPVAPASQPSSAAPPIK